jgi:hypothetical protein
VNARDKDGATALHKAAGMGHKDVVEVLLANKADVNAQSNGGITPLQVAAYKGNKEIVKILLPTTITVDGISYSNVTFGVVTPITVSITHKTGVATIPLEKLSPDLQECFGYDPEKAAEYRKAVADAEQRRIQQHKQIEPERVEQPRQSTPSQVLSRIKAKAQAKWPDDFEMQAYTIKNQTEAYWTVQGMASVSGVPSSVLEKIKSNAVSKWPEDYEMQVYTIKNQTEAYKSLH